MKKRKIELMRKNDVLMAPKRAHIKKDEGKGSKRRKERPVGMELTFPRDDPGVPDMLAEILKLYNLLNESEYVKGKKSNPLRSSSVDQDRQSVGQASIEVGS